MNKISKFIHFKIYDKRWGYAKLLKYDDWCLKSCNVGKRVIKGALKNGREVKEIK